MTGMDESKEAQGAREAKAELVRFWKAAPT